MAVIVPFESRSPATIDRLSELVAADMERVNTTILSRTGSQVAMIPEVAHIGVANPVRLLNNTLQGFASLRATFRR